MEVAERRSEGASLAETWLRGPRGRENSQLKQFVPRAPGFINSHRKLEGVRVGEQGKAAVNDSKSDKKKGPV